MDALAEPITGTLFCHVTKYIRACNIFKQETQNSPINTISPFLHSSALPQLPTLAANLPIKPSLSRGQPVNASLPLSQAMGPFTRLYGGMTNKSETQF